MVPLRAAGKAIVTPPGMQPWTDDFSSLLGILK
jgi:hypothetical protein